MSLPDLNRIQRCQLRKGGHDGGVADTKWPTTRGAATAWNLDKLENKSIKRVPSKEPDENS
jgi:hypothetical protein